MSDVRRERARPREGPRRSVYTRLLREARDYWPHLLGLLLLSLLSSVFAVLTPVPLKIAVDSVVNGEPLPGFLDAVLPGAVTGSRTSVLAFAALSFVAIAVLKQVQQAGVLLLSTYTGQKLLLRFRARLFSHAQRVSLTYHDSRGTSDSAYRIQYDAPAIQNVLVMGAVPLFTSIATVTGMLYVTARIDGQLALVALAVVPLLFGVLRLYRRRFHAYWHDAKHLESSALSVVNEALSALRVVTAFGQEERERDRFTQRSRQSVRARMGLARSESAFGLAIGLIIGGGTAAVLLIGTRRVLAGSLTLGELVLIMGYLQQLYEPLRSASKKVGDLQSSLASAERVYALLDEAPAIVERRGARPLRRARGEVSFEDVSFGYERDHPVLRGVSFELPSGTRLGISGTTGAGKTTLVSLLTRFYDPAEGRILLDGIDLRDYRIADVRDQFGIVLQEPVLFSTSVRENIGYARPSAPASDILAAAKAANADGFISALPDGYDTQVGERGMRLSGGERQRISLARAFLKDAPILILDEPTSAVDNRTEAAIVEAMERLMVDRTTFVIAHRLSTLAHCDVRLELEDGRVAAVGPAEQWPALLASRRGGTPRRGARREAHRNGNVVAHGSVSRVQLGPGHPAPPRHRRPPRSTGAVAEASSPQHPAVRAWRQVGPEHAEPLGIDLLKRRKSSVYRLAGLGPDGADVIAKRGRRKGIAMERWIYEEVLPSVPVASLRCYGMVDDDGDRDYAWLFIEDAGQDEREALEATEQAVAARWIAAVHTTKLEDGVRKRLPNRGPEYYLEHLSSARNLLVGHLDDHGLGASDREVLASIVAQCGALSLRWSAVERVSEHLPWTLVHGDYQPTNVRVPTGGDGGACLVFDWDDAGWGPPAADLLELREDPSALRAYWSAVTECWPGVGVEDVQRQADLGFLLWLVRVIGLETLGLARGTPGGRLPSKISAYERMLPHAVARVAPER